jgi:hypothetical protein
MGVVKFRCLHALNISTAFSVSANFPWISFVSMLPTFLYDNSLANIWSVTYMVYFLVYGKV